jgi:hypothetical protein
VLTGGMRRSSDGGRRGGREVLREILHVRKGIRVAPQHQKGRGGSSVQWLTEGGDPAAEQQWRDGSVVTQVRQA